MSNNKEELNKLWYIDMVKYFKVISDVIKVYIVYDSIRCSMRSTRCSQYFIIKEYQIICVQKLIVF